MSINRVILEGNVGRDPIIRYFSSGNVKATFPLATSSSYTSQTGETVSSTEWHNVVFWRGLATMTEKDVKKGSRIFVTGSIRTRQYTDKDGNQKYITEIIGDSLFVYSNNRSEYRQEGQIQDKQPQFDGKNQTAQGETIGSDPFFENIPQIDAEEDDLPF